jgi:hypothetical protein
VKSSAGVARNSGLALALLFATAAIELLAAGAAVDRHADHPHRAR